MVLKESLTRTRINITVSQSTDFGFKRARESPESAIPPTGTGTRIAYLKLPKGTIVAKRIFSAVRVKEQVHILFLTVSVLI